jgi:hypothetical protein
MNINKPIGELLFDTNDLGLAAFLKLSGLELKIMTKNKGRTIFCFKDKPERKQLVGDYFNGKARVSPLAYKNLLRDLKIFTLNQT